MFSIFKKKNQVTDVKWLGIDVHSHLLPGIDDGSPNIEQSIKLIKGLSELGFTKFICTPHIFNELYPNTFETIDLALRSTRDAVKLVSKSIDISAGAEYMIDENFVVNKSLICLSEKYILIEMSYLNESPNIEQVIFNLQINGYHVILAHPERYVFYYKDYKKFHRYKDMGVLFQLNLLSITGYYGKESKKVANYLLENQMYDLAATDLHHDRHLEELTKAVRSGYVHEVLGQYPFQNKAIFE